MFELFLIFCLAFILTVIGSQTGILIPAAIPLVGVLAGGVVGFAYSGAAFPGAAAGLLAAGSFKLLYISL